ncbi:SDR family oxidoreductase [Pontibacter cellulosilyticus]|uniref:SDR family oxidoreductase n=1 Tax=Pontibacter cellulosilyticus TaxID=1720253 RepID=A0A923N478_9BACT|nr:SDR family oxidoreductase [Pontibacter cellulosilyticus]MBC5991559.1 SDR family oxidoreductase [Pontibacter cellulosilyticus]
MGDKQVISVLGCGWLGLPLASQLVKSGYTVKGSTTSPEKLDLLKEKGIQPYLLNLNAEHLQTNSLPDFLEADVLVLNIPPKLRSDGGKGYLQQMRTLIKLLINSTVSRVLFVSSTSVYQDLNRIVTEEDITFTDELEPDNMLLQAERLFLDREEWVTTIVRFGGLIGGERHPGKFLAGKKHLPNGDAPINMIHQDDCIAILHRIIEQDKWGNVYNACADGHPLRKDFFPVAAERLGLTPPEFDDMQETHFKLIKSQKLKDDLSYVFLHPDPMLFF